MLTRKRRPATLLLIIALLPIILAACSADTGIFAGGTWQAGSLQNRHIRALAVNANDTQTIYAADEQGHVFLSSDAGQHWTEHSSGLPLPVPVHMLTFDSTGKKLYAATDKGIYVTSERVEHWQSLSASGAPATAYLSLDVDPAAPAHLFAGTAHQGVLISRDGGATWTAANNGLAPGTAVYGITFDTNQHWLWAATSSGVYRTDEQATTWQAMNKGLPAGTTAYTVQPASLIGADKNLVYLGTARGFYFSRDAGANWSKAQENLAATTIHRILIDFRRTDARTLFVATSVGAFRSSDGGQTWGGIASGLPRQKPVYDLTLGGNNYSQLFAAVDNVYLYPGSSGGLSGSRILIFLLVAALFFFLFQMTHRRRRRMLTAHPETQQAVPPSTPPTSEH